MIPTIFTALLFSLMAYAIPVSAADNPAPKTMVEIQGLVSQYCGVCHDVPRPSLMPKHSWPYAIQRMAEVAEQRMGKPFIPAAALRDITAFYYGTAEESLARLPVFPNDTGPLSFVSEAIGEPTKMPLISHIEAVDLVDGSLQEFLISDVEHNRVVLLTKSKKGWQERVLGTVVKPVRTTVADYDGDGLTDVLVASLGKFFPPVDIEVGKVILLRQTKSGVFEPHILMDKIPRVLDVQAVDIDGDKDLDIALAIFGNDNVGELAWLENKGGYEVHKHTILNLAGGLNMSPADLNGDGRIDFVSVISQENEMIVALMNRGKGAFDQHVLFRASDPMIGSTGMTLVDIDKDYDLDILFTNGDAHDLQTDPKPYHGVGWLENVGPYQYVFHNVGRFYGASHAAVADMDGDGDNDIVASSWNNYWEEPDRQTLIWFENNGEQVFSRHNIASRPHNIVSFELVDVVGDSRPDIVAGLFKIELLKKYWSTKVDDEEKAVPMMTREQPKKRLVVFENQLNKTPP
ncbi:FG-GAP repeat domain-containing protein [Teredinibacter purpureus]|uniref:FG-GAP repeat domain-containing protein n=1 Tax=Teredinibacter purpureus TaxID=2731756 RepID=UPI0006985AA4|nr:VCBS repeat-containing protein [Teredinibacter purpureus]